MTNQHSPQTNPDQPAVYRIRIEGRIAPHWAASFDGLAITYEANDTLLTGPVVDQAALHGLLRKVRDMGLTLLSVERIESE